MNKQLKEVAAKSDGEQLKVFVRTSPQELAVGDIEIVAGGNRGLIVPWG